MNTIHRCATHGIPLRFCLLTLQQLQSRHRGAAPSLRAMESLPEALEDGTLAGAQHKLAGRRGAPGRF
jgi:hypothetical protein